MAINFNGVRVRPSVVAPEPSPPTDSLGAWWRADDAGTVDGSNVTSWTDRTGYSQTLTTVGGGVNLPTWQASVANLGGRPAVNFGANKGLALSLPSGILGGTNALTMYAVIDVDSFTNSAFFFYGPLGSTTVGASFSAIVLTSPNVVGTSIYGATSLTPGSATRQIVSVRAAANSQWGNSFLTVDGATPSVSYANPTASLNVPEPVASVSVGGGDGAYDFRGRIAEILYYRKNQDGTERAETLVYLSKRYGITLA